MEELAFLAGQQKDWQERGDDDDGGKEDASGYLFAGPFDDGHPFREGDVVVVFAFSAIFKRHDYDLFGE
jgi:hypothetical protein